MSGVVLETVSNRKLISFAVILLVLQIICYLIGGLIAPSPFSTITHTGVPCVERRNSNRTKIWQHPWIVPGKDKEKNCDKIVDFQHPVLFNQSVSADEIVFGFRYPLPKMKTYLKFSPWHQSLLGVLQFVLKADSNIAQGDNPVLTLEARLGGRNVGEKHWNELGHATVERNFKCSKHNDSSAYIAESYSCDVLPFFELGSCFYEHYIVNFGIPTTNFRNADIGEIDEVTLVLIHQNGGFTQVWFSLKTVFFPVILGALVWFWRRVATQMRPSNLLERTHIALGLAMTFINLPVEWLSLWFNMPFMLLLSDVRQGVFYAVLLCFWLIFVGEHMMDQVNRNELVWYWKQLSAVVFGCICLFVFEMCERGVQITNPFFSIWATDTGTKLGLACVVLAAIAASLYFIFLCYNVGRVLRNIWAKKSALPHMIKARSKFYMKIIYRFNFLMIATVLCAALTVIFFIISQVGDSDHKWGEPNSLEYRSAFLTGVYGMWNLYVFALLVLYAPSRKYITAEAADDSNEDEEIEFTNIPSEASALRSFASKAQMD